MGDAAAAAVGMQRFSTGPVEDVRCLVDAGSLAWRARLHPDWVTPPDPMPLLKEAGSLDIRRKRRYRVPRAAGAGRGE